MHVLRHWHPVLKSESLEASPVGITLHGQELVLFRDGAGRVGALRDVCPHRGMRLSRGSVVEGRLRCPYHGWSYDTEGAGTPPCTPQRTVRATAFDAAERYGAIWVRAAGSDSAFPQFDHHGYYHMGLLTRRVKGPLEVVLDNFNEVEHTPTTHLIFGYALEAMPDVVTRVETTRDTVRVYNEGPQKPMPWVVERLFGVRSGDPFIDDWTTHFSPVHTRYHQWWKDKATGEPRPDQLYICVFFTPVDEDTTDLFVFLYAHGPRQEKLLLRAVLKPVSLWLTRREIDVDANMIERLADKSPGLKGKKLSRFDRALAENRRRIDRVYRGVEPG